MGAGALGCATIGFQCKPFVGTGALGSATAGFKCKPFVGAGVLGSATMVFSVNPLWVQEHLVVLLRFSV